MSNANMQGLTSTTAPGKIFASRGELAEHYKSDWHKYNLKRREANMAMLTHDEFSARLEAAIALRKEREGLEARSGKDHLKDKNKSKSKSGKNKKKNTNGGGNTNRVSKRQLRQLQKRGIPNENVEEHEDDEIMEDDDTEVQQQTHQEEPPEIDPCQSLFNKHISSNVDENIKYMYKEFGFFVPDVEFLVDKEGLIGYCHEKIKLGHTCLYCQRTFSTWRGCQEHMINSRHCKLKYEAGIDLEEFDVFYDFTADDEDFLKSGIGNHHRRRGGKKSLSKAGQDDDVMVEDEDVEVVSDDEDGEWEDVDSDEEMEGEEDQGLYAAYQEEITRHGFDITPLGELIFPDGRIIGHRGLSKYYKQRLASEDDRTAVVAARRANGERLYQGRVYDTYAMREEAEGGNKEMALSLAKAGLSIGAVAGRQGRGILVPTNGGSRGNSFTALSLYRYKAAMKKAKREEFKGRRLQERTTLPMNKMDKKANRLFNNVSVAHAPR